MKRILSFMLAALLMGCASHERTEMKVVPGEAEQTRVEVAATPERTTIKFPDGTSFEHVGPTTRSTTESGKGVGAGASATGDKASLNVNGAPPDVKLPGGGQSTGGGIDSKSQGSRLEAAVNQVLSNKLLVVGMILCAAAFGMWYFGNQTKIAIGTAIFGLGLMAAAFWPWLLLVAILVLVVYAWTAYGTHRAVEPLRAALAGVGSLPTETKATVMDAISQHAEPSDTVAITRVATADGVKL